jgi:nucleoside-diphosphate-sugar epimerase
MNVLISGGTGFFGYWLSKTQPKGIAARYMNRNDYENSHWEWYDWDAVIHCANVSPLRVFQNHRGKVMYVSSGAVKERDDEYTNNKRKWEAQCPEGTIIVRPYCFMGEKIPDRYSFKQFVNDGLRGGPIHYYDVGCIRSYMHGFDLGTWMWKMLLYGDGIYDIGSDMPVNMGGLAKAIANYFDCEAVADLEVEYEQEYKIYLPDITRAKELGLKVTIGLGEGIDRTVKYERTKNESS